MLFNRLYQLFRRYAARHLDMCQPGFDLNDNEGRSLGRLEQIRLTGNRLTLQGWSTADRVALTLPGSRTEQRPHLPPQGGKAPGFLLDQPFRYGEVILSVELCGQRTDFPVPAFMPRSVHLAKLRLLGVFARDLCIALPGAIRWLVKHDADARADIKAALRLTPSFAPFVLDNGVFATSRDTPSMRPVSVTIVLPVFNAFDLLKECLGRVVAHTDLPWHLILVEDGSTDERVRPFLRSWVADLAEPSRLTLIENPGNIGFVQSVNLAMQKALMRDDHVILLNSDALVPPGWSSRLIRPVLADDSVATVTPMSNDAEIFSVPVICTRSALKPGQVDMIDETAARLNPDHATAEAPTGVGFCMAMNLRFLLQLPALDTVFGRGYGEEVDWCQKVRALGGRHVGLSNLFVEHRGGTSFGSAEKQRLVLKNNAVISRRYPAYDREVQDFIAEDPLATARLALGIAYAASQTEEALPIYFAHSLGGGAEMYLQSRIADDLTKVGAAIVLRVGGPMRWGLELYSNAGVTRGGTDSFELVQAMLESATLRRVVYSCAVGDRDPFEIPAAMLSLKQGPGDSIEVLFHDFFPLSPSYCLLNSAAKFTGVPKETDSDPAHEMHRQNGTVLPLKDWRAAWRPVIRAASEILVFSNDSKAHVLSAYPEAAGAIKVQPHCMLTDVPTLAAPATGKLVVGVLGNIGLQKGAGLLGSIGNALAAAGDGPLVLVGNVDPAFALPPTVVLHGEYKIDDIEQLVRRYGITCWLIPSIWPETFSFTTHEALATGLPVFCFDLGAQAEAVRAAPNGMVLPYGLAPGDIVKHLKKDTSSFAVSD